MLKFNQFLKESSSKIKFVYHVTKDESAKNIFKHNYFRVSKNAETGKPGLSTTYDPTYIWGGGEVRFKLDLQKIKKDFKVIGVEPLKGIPDESEILILNDGAILNIDKYIESIDIKTKSRIKDDAHEYGKKYNIKINEVNKFK